MTGLVCALYSVARSVLAVLALLPLGYAAFYTIPVSGIQLYFTVCIYSALHDSCPVEGVDRQWLSRV